MKKNKSFNERNIADELNRMLRASDVDLPDSLRPDNIVSRIKQASAPSITHSSSARSYRRWIPIAASCAACLLLTVFFLFQTFGMHTVQKSCHSSSEHTENAKLNASTPEKETNADTLFSDTDSLANGDSGSSDILPPQATVKDESVRATTGTGKGTSANASEAPTHASNAGNTSKTSAKPSASDNAPCCPPPDVSGSASLNIDESKAREWIAEGALVIDLRTSAEYNTGHVAKAVNISPSQLKAVISSYADIGKTVIVYHSTNDQSIKAAEDLRALQYNAYSLGAFDPAWAELL